MSRPKEDGNLSPSPPAAEKPCPGGDDIPREGSREIKKDKIISVPYDWCKSKTKIVPYRIWAWQADAGNLANTVRQTDCRSHVLGSIVKECYGDDPGKGGGIISRTHNASCTPMTHSQTVFAEGRPMVRFLDKWYMNNKNTWGCLNNSENTGNFKLPDVKLIGAKMPNPNEGGPRTVVAQAAPFPSSGGLAGGAAAAAAPLVGGTLKAMGQGLYGLAPDKDETLGDYLYRPIINLNLMMGKTKVNVGGKVHWVRITKQDPKCPLCKTITGKLVESGTWGYSPLDIVPLNKQQHGIAGPHHNLWLANQIPHPDCRCQWQRQRFAAFPNRLPQGAIPWEPFLNTP